MQSVKNRMSYELIMPKLGLTNTEGTIAIWKVAEGSSVKKGDALLEIENEKTTVEFESPSDGILHIFAEAGTEVLVGNLMGYLAADQAEYNRISNDVAADQAEENRITKNVAADQAEENRISSDQTSDLEEGQRIKASPLAKKIASKAGLNLAGAKGTGPGGRIIKKDVEIIQSGFANSTAVDARECTAVQPATDQPAADQSVRTPVIIPMSVTRKAIAKRMYESLKSMAQTSDSVEIDVTELAKLRRKFASRESEFGTKITMNDLFALAAIKMLGKHPLANAELSGNEIITYPYVNLSMAVATDYGLTSPVIRDADKLSLIQLSKALKEIIQKARDNRLAMNDLTGGTFTITNMGIYPVDNFNPIINPPQSAILGFGRAVEKPAVVEGQIVVRTMMVLSITYDHRVFDGSEVGSIMRDMKEYLENPELILV